MLAGADLFGEVANPAMLRLARDYARRCGLVFVGIAHEAALTATVPVACYRDSRGAMHRRTLDDLRASETAKPASRKVPASVVDSRTLALF